MNSTNSHTPILLWPFKFLFGFIETILKLTGRLAAALIGLALMLAGGVLTALVITAPIGIPLAAFGFLLMLRAIF
jgi:hypothetical protein